MSSVDLFYLFLSALDMCWMSKSHGKKQDCHHLKYCSSTISFFCLIFKKFINLLTPAMWFYHYFAIS